MSYALLLAHIVVAGLDFLMQDKGHSPRRLRTVVESEARESTAEWCTTACDSH